MEMFNVLETPIASLTTIFVSLIHQNSCYCRSFLSKQSFPPKELTYISGSLIPTTPSSVFHLTIHQTFVSRQAFNDRSTGVNDRDQTPDTLVRMECFLWQTHWHWCLNLKRRKCTNQHQRAVSSQMHNLHELALHRPSCLGKWMGKCEVCSVVLGKR